MKISAEPMHTWVDFARRSRSLVDKRLTVAEHLLGPVRERAEHAFKHGQTTIDLGDLKGDVGRAARLARSSATTIEAVLDAARGDAHAQLDAFVGVDEYRGAARQAHAAVDMLTSSGDEVSVQQGFAAISAVREARQFTNGLGMHLNRLPATPSAGELRVRAAASDVLDGVEFVAVANRPAHSVLKYLRAGGPIRTRYDAGVYATLRPRPNPDFAAIRPVRGEEFYGSVGMVLQPQVLTRSSINSGDGMVTKFADQPWSRLDAVLAQRLLATGDKEGRVLYRRIEAGLPNTSDDLRRYLIDGMYQDRVGRPYYLQAIVPDAAVEEVQELRVGLGSLQRERPDDWQQVLRELHSEAEKRSIPLVQLD